MKSAIWKTMYSASCIEKKEQQPDRPVAGIEHHELSKQIEHHGLCLLL
jgi:hypothetical protein